MAGVTTWTAARAALMADSFRTRRAAAPMKVRLATCPARLGDGVLMVKLDVVT